MKILFRAETGMNVLLTVHPTMLALAAAPRRESQTDMGTLALRRYLEGRPVRSRRTRTRKESDEATLMATT